MPIFKRFEMRPLTISEKGGTSMKNFKKYELIAIILIISALLFASCSGGSSNEVSGSVSAGDATLSGIVADGYISNANVYAYSDSDMTTPIGSGITDSNGNFSITLSASSVPDPIYLKSVGGTDVATGMPGPTMLFVGSGSSGTFNITPLTDCLYKYSLTLGIDGARNYLTGELGISNLELYDDPVANTDLNGALNSILSSGTMDGTLTDGDYVVEIVYFEWDSGDEGEMNVTISNGVISGNADLWGDSWFATGKVQGSSMVLTMADDPDPASADNIIRIAGDIGLLGSVAGMYTYAGNGDPEIYSGMFVASFVPAGGIDPTGVANVISNIYSGSRHIIFRDIFGESESYHLTWGDLNIDIDPDTGSVTAEDTTLWFDWGTDPNDGDFVHPDDQTVELQFVSGEFLQTSGELTTNIIFLEFEIVDPYSVTVEFYQAVGSRRGIFVMYGDLFAIGDVYMATGEGLGPSFKVDTDYEVKIAVAHVDMLGQPRSDWIGSGADEMPFSDNFTTPPVFDNADPDFSSNVLKIYNGSLIAFKSDANNGGLDDEFDYVRLVELFESGAIQGEEILGGDPGELDNPLSYYPATFVGFIKKPGETAPSVSGKRNFLSRVLYSTEVLVYGEADAYINAYVTGDLSISGSSATLNYTDPSGSSGTAPLTVENTEGLSHIHGTLDGSTYIDIFWPAGGKKAVYITSDNETGDWLIIEVGEAYLSH